MTLYNEQQEGYMRLQRPVEKLSSDLFYASSGNNGKKDTKPKENSGFRINLEGQLAGI